MYRAALLVGVLVLLVVIVVWHVSKLVFGGETVVHRALQTAAALTATAAVLTVAAVGAVGSAAAYFSSAGPREVEGPPREAPLTTGGAEAAAEAEAEAPAEAPPKWDIFSWTDERYLDAIGAAPELREALERKGCVPEPTFWEMGRPAVVDGFAVRVLPKGTRIYKGMHGYTRPERFMELVRASGGRPWWFGKLYFSLSFAQVAWGGLLCFELQRDLVLIDGFSLPNVKKINARLIELGLHKLARQYRLIKGYRVSPKEQLDYIVGPRETAATAHLRKSFEEKFHSGGRNRQACAVRDLEPGLLPHSVKNIMVDIQIFEQILNRLPRIDGWVHDHVRPALTPNKEGVWQFEELVLKSAAVLDGIRCGMDSPATWMNWKFKGFTMPPEGVDVLFANNKRGANDDFRLVKFMIRSRYEKTADLGFLRGAEFRERAPGGVPGGVPGGAPSTLALTFNVHGFSPLFADMGEQSRPVADWLRAAAPDLVVLQEATWAAAEEASPTGAEASPTGLQTSPTGPHIAPGESSPLSEREFFERAGYPHHVSAANGSSRNDLFVAVAAKKPLRDVEIFETAEAGPRGASPAGPAGPASLRSRGAVVFRYEGLRVAAVHLEIGERFNGWKPKTDPERALVERANSALRIAALRRLPLARLDVLVGDFNFELADPEAEFLRGEGFRPQGEDFLRGPHGGDGESPGGEGESPGSGGGEGESPQSIQTIQTTPFNRVDHFFVREGVPVGGNAVVQVDFSDHFPVFQAL